MLTTASTTAGASAADLETDAARVARIDAVLSEDAVVARRWYFAWSLGFGTVYLADTIVAWKTTDEATHASARVGAVLNALGFLSTIVAPPPGIFYASDRRARRADLEEKLRVTSDFESLGQSWLAHALGITANAIGGAVLWLHYDRPFNGLVTFVVGSLVGEAKIATAPTRAKDFAKASGVATTMELVPWVSQGVMGAALVGEL